MFFYYLYFINTIKNIVVGIGQVVSDALSKIPTFDFQKNKLGHLRLTQLSKAEITSERDQAIQGHTAMARYGKPEELLGAVLWLASDAASFVTGAEFAIDGGFSSMTI